MLRSQPRRQTRWFGWSGITPMSRRYHPHRRDCPPLSQAAVGPHVDRFSPSRHKNNHVRVNGRCGSIPFVVTTAGHHRDLRIGPSAALCRTSFGLHPGPIGEPSALCQLIAALQRGAVASLRRLCRSKETSTPPGEALVWGAAAPWTVNREPPLSQTRSPPLFWSEGINLFAGSLHIWSSAAQRAAACAGGGAAESGRASFSLLPWNRHEVGAL